MHWTPVRVANEISRFLAPNERSRVLDVGSGCGKFCVIGALSTPGHFYGVEQKEPLHAAAVSLASRLKVGRAHFIHADAFAQDWNEFSALYFYNPFGEARFTSPPFDALVGLATPQQFDLFISRAREKLEGLRPGIRVATYHGFGGHFPTSFRLIHSMSVPRGVFELWTKET